MQPLNIFDNTDDMKEPITDSEVIVTDKENENLLRTTLNEVIVLAVMTKTHSFLYTQHHCRLLDTPPTSLSSHLKSFSPQVLTLCPSERERVRASS